MAGSTGARLIGGPLMGQCDGDRNAGDRRQRATSITAGSVARRQTPDGSRPAAAHRPGSRRDRPPAGGRWRSGSARCQRGGPPVRSSRTTSCGDYGKLSIIAVIHGSKLWKVVINRERNGHGSRCRFPVISWENRYRLPCCRHFRRPLNPA